MAGGEDSDLLKTIRGQYSDLLRNKTLRPQDNIRDEIAAANTPNRVNQALDQEITTELEDRVSMQGDEPEEAVEFLKQQYANDPQRLEAIDRIANASKPTNNATNNNAEFESNIAAYEKALTNRPLQINGKPVDIRTFTETLKSDMLKDKGFLNSDYMDEQQDGKTVEQIANDHVWDYLDYLTDNNAEFIGDNEYGIGDQNVSDNAMDEIEAFEQPRNPDEQTKIDAKSNQNQKDFLRTETEKSTKGLIDNVIKGEDGTWLYNNFVEQMDDEGKEPTKDNLMMYLEGTIDVLESDERSGVQERELSQYKQLLSSLQKSKPVTIRVSGPESNADDPDYKKKTK